MDLIAVASDWLSTGQWWLKLTLVGAATAGLAWSQVRPLLLDVFGRTDSIKRRVDTLKVLYEISSLKTAAGQPADEKNAKKWTDAIGSFESNLVRDLSDDDVTSFDRKLKALIGKGVLWLVGLVVTASVQYLLARSVQLLLAGSPWFMIFSPWPMLVVAFLAGYRMSVWLLSRIAFYWSKFSFEGNGKVADKLLDHMAMAMDCFYVVELAVVCIRVVWVLKGH